MDRFILKTILSIIFIICSYTNIIYSALLNSASFPEQTSQFSTKTENGAEYLIITYNETGFVEKLTELQQFRIAQGISTNLITTTEIGGNSVDTIKYYISEAYTSWDIPPKVILLVGDHDKIPGPTFQSGQEAKTDISDNYYVDMDGDGLPDMTIARLPIDDLFSLTNYINRLLEYEISPPNYSSYYYHPVTSMSWTDDSQNMFNAQVTNGFFNVGLSKEPLQENDLFYGSVGDSWFVSPELLNYFGPEGLDYIPATPEYLTDWSGNAANINTNLNNGSFMMVNLDHGTELGWSSPEYWYLDIQGINSADPFFLISINNLNGKFNWSLDCFAEGLINHQYGAAGVIASTTNINETVSSEYYFALIDELWDNFMPDISSGNNIYPYTLPAFANTRAKYRIANSGLSNIESTIRGYHYFGEPFMPVYYNYPDTLTIVHNSAFTEGIQTFEVTADSGSTICLSANNTILSSDVGTGNVLALLVDSLSCEDTLIVTVTKQNYIRYSVNVICSMATKIKNEESNSIQLFPNPANDAVKVICHEFADDPTSIFIYNYSGKIVREKHNIYFPYQIERQGLPSGIYFIKLKTDNKISKKVKLIFK